MGKLIGPKSYKSKLTEKGFYLTEENVYVRATLGIVTTAYLRNNYIYLIEHHVGDVLLGRVEYRNRLTCALGYQQELDPINFSRATPAPLQAQEIAQVLAERGFTREVTEEGPKPFEKRYGPSPSCNMFSYAEVCIDIQGTEEEPLLYLTLQGTNSHKTYLAVTNAPTVFTQVQGAGNITEPEKPLLYLTWLNLTKAINTIEQEIGLKEVEPKRWT